MKTKKKKNDLIICSVCNSGDNCYITFNDGVKIPYFTMSLAYGTITCNHCIQKSN